jgi:hypothetical protein
VVLAAADFLLILDAFSESPTVGGWFMAIHIALTFAAFVASRASIASSGWNSLAIPLGAAFGPCGMLAIHLVNPWSFQGAAPSRPATRPRRPDPKSAKLYAPITPGVMLARLLDRRITFPAADQIESLDTILRGGPLPARRRALEAAVRSFEPRLSTLVASALRDPDQTIRALAAAAAAQVGHNLSQQLAETEEAVPSFDTLYTRAMLLFEHGCHNVLLPQTLRAKHRRSAFEYLQECRLSAPKDDKRLSTIVDALGMLRLELASAQPERPKLVHLREMPADHGG